MATIINGISTTQVSLSNGKDAYVAAGASLAVDGVTAIDGSGNNHSVIVAGQVDSTTIGLKLGGDAALHSGQYLEILKTGSINGDTYGVVIYGANSSILNHGVISGGFFAIILDVDSATQSQSVTNTGTIISDTGLVRNGTSDLGTVNIYNSGSIIGFDFAFYANASQGIDRIYNKGRMDGNIEFDGGNDLYDGRGGTFKGTAFGEAGDDTFIGGNGIERFDGGIGADKFTGGLGKDVLTMGTGVGDGIDKIIFNAVTEIGDIVTDFATSDFFQFKKSAFGNLALGTLSSAAYHENTTGAAHDASDRFIFETDTSRLWYDKDGTGSAAKVLVADMSNTVNISNADIQII